MTALTWDEIGQRKYETGIDRGVLYLPNGTAVPWNGLTSVTENPDYRSSPVYYDGRKISDMVSLGDFSASLKAFTYPDEFEVLQGLGKFQDGIFLGEQRPKPFGLSYRTKLGNDLNSEAGYKIHVLYNLFASPKNKTHQTIGNSVDPEEFEWDIFAIPEEVTGFAPTARIIINTRDVDPDTLVALEEVFYGSEDEDPSLISMNDLLIMIGFPTLLAVQIIDNGDGTWTAIGDTVVDNGDGSFTITNANSTMLDIDTYRVSSTSA